MVTPAPAQTVTPGLLDHVGVVGSEKTLVPPLPRGTRAAVIRYQPGMRVSIAVDPPSVGEPPQMVAIPALRELNSAVEVFLHRVGNWLAGLPGGPVSTFLEGALLMVRRTLFNQGPDVTPLQETTTSEGVILGSLGAVDPEADALSFAVVDDPQFGSVVVDEYGDYAYTPGAGFSGEDSFTVRVTADGGGINLLDLWSAGSREVTVAVGSDAPTNPFMAGLPDAIDSALYLQQATAAITLVKRSNWLQGDQYRATVALEGITADTELLWMDAKGRTGEVSVAQLLSTSDGTSWWNEFAEAGELSNDGVMLGLDFIGADGTQNTMILSNVAASVVGEGYVFSGDLAPNPDQQPDIDQWDVLGSEFKDSYENFLTTYLTGAERVVLQVDGADLYASTYSPVTYANIIVGTDPGISPAELGIGGPQRAATTSVPLDSDGLQAPVTAAMPYGAGFVMGTDYGTVWAWNGANWKELQGTGWGSGIQAMLPYRDGFVVGLRSSAVEYWDGKAWTELHNGSFNSWLEAMVPYGDPSDNENGPIGFVIGLADGSLQQWTGDTWIGLESTGFGSKVTSMIQYNDGFLVGRSNGTVSLFTPGRSGLACPNCAAVSELQPYPEWGSAVTAMLPYGGGFVVGLNNGSVQQWTGSAWNELAGTAWGSGISKLIPYESGFIAGLQSSSLQYWTGTGWQELHDGGWSSSLETMMPYRNGVVVGLNNGSVQQWSPTIAVGDAPAGLALNPTGTLAYVANSGSNSVSVVDTDTWETAATIGVGGGPGRVALDADRGLAYVTNYTSHSVSVIDTTTNTVRNTVDVGINPIGLAVATLAPFAPAVYVANRGSDSVTYINTSFAPGEVAGVGSISVGRNPYGVAATRDGANVYVTNLGSGTVSVIDTYTQAVTATIEVGPAPTGIAVNPDGTRVYVSGLAVGATGTMLSVIDTATNTVTARFSVDKTTIAASSDVAVNPDGTRIFVTNSKSGQVSVIDAATNTVLTAVDVGSGQNGIVVNPNVNNDPGGDYVYVTRDGFGKAGTVSVIDPVTFLDLTGGGDADGLRELHAPGGGEHWNGAITALLPYGNTFVVGMSSGTVQQFTGTGWEELEADRIALDEKRLKAAVEFARNGGKATASDDPLFSTARFLPACSARNSCNGTFYPVELSRADPWQLWSKSYSIGTGGQSLDLSLDLGEVSYGYLYVPSGLWGKLKVGKYGAGFMVALPTGPSATLNLAGGDGTFTFGPERVYEGSPVYEPTPYGVFGVDVAIDADLKVSLNLPEDFGKDALSAHAYYVPGILLTLNTAAKSGLQIGYSAYPDIDFSDFTEIRGVTLTPTVTPQLTAKYGLFTPANTPILGKQDVLSINLGYSNPLSLALDLALNQPPSLTLKSRGDATFSAGILSSLTDALTFSDEFPVYETETGNLLGGAGDLLAL